MVDFATTESGGSRNEETPSSAVSSVDRGAQERKEALTEIATMVVDITHGDRRLLRNLLAQAQEPHVERAYSAYLVRIQELRRGGREPLLAEKREALRWAVLAQFSGGSETVGDPEAE